MEPGDLDPPTPEPAADDELLRRLAALGPTLDRASAAHAGDDGVGSVPPPGAGDAHPTLLPLRRHHRAHSPHPGRRVVAVAAAVLLVAGAAVALRLRNDGGHDDQAPVVTTEPDGSDITVLPIDADGADLGIQVGPDRQPHELWSVPAACAPTFVGACLATDEERAYLLDAGRARNEDPPGPIAVTAVDGPRGEEVWSVEIPGTERTTDQRGGISSDGGLILIQIPRPAGGAGVDGSVAQTFHTYALDARDGALRWDHPGTTTLFRTPGLVVLNDPSDDLVTTEAALTTVLRADDGSTAWTAPGRPVGLCDGRLLIRSEAAVTGYDVGTGATTWTAEAGTNIAATCNADGVFTVDVPAGGDFTDTTLTAWGHDGTRRWTRSVSERTQVRIVGSNLLVTTESDDEDADNLLLDETGRPIWTATGQVGFTLRSDGNALLHHDGLSRFTLAEAQPSPVGPVLGDAASYSLVIGSNVLVVQRGGIFVGYDAGTLERTWSVELREGMVWALALGGGRAYALTGEHLIAYG